MPQKGVEIIETELCPEHIHMLVYMKTHNVADRETPFGWNRKAYAADPDRYDRGDKGVGRAKRLGPSGFKQIRHSRLPIARMPAVPFCTCMAKSRFREIPA